MDKKRLQELAGIQLNESNDRTMFNEELKDIAKAIMNGWDRAKALNIDYEEFSHIVKRVSDGALQDLED